LGVQYNGKFVFGEVAYENEKGRLFSLPFGVKI